ncbi:MAG TPA: GC-type dockerin domain-anchored protein [Phycisphaerales bacterium]|nr:GC-type dockerin domain-anchored protein [Phycisphaerales bacterium]
MALALAGSVSAQCSLYRWSVPDFDQKRTGLPGNGGMYCVPTSATNWMAYISNQGFPPMMSGPRNWQSQANFGFVTTTDALMGSLMGTTTADGTYGGAGNDGLKAYMFARAPFLFTSTVWYDAITPLNVYVQMANKGLVDVCYGYYKQFPGPNGNYYVRDGGHCVTLTGIERACLGGNNPVFRVRDPADDGTLGTQSTFATATSRGPLETFNTTPLPGSAETRTRMLDFGVGSTTRRYLDTMYVIRANFACWAPAATSLPHIHLNFAAALFGDPGPAETTFVLPAGSFATCIAIHPDQTKIGYVLCTPVGAGATYRLIVKDLTDGGEQDLGLLLPAVQGKTPISFDRFGRLLACDGSVLKVFDIRSRVPGVVAMRTLASPASGLCFDDAHDEVVVLTPANARLIRLMPDLTPVADEPLPSDVPAMADGSVVPDPINHRFLVAAVGDGSVRELSMIGGTPRLMVSQTLLLPAVQSIQELKPADGGAFFVLGDGSVRILERNPASGLLQLSQTALYGGLPPMRCMSLSRSRTNFDPGLHTGPAWRNLPDADEGIAPVPDCAADYNLNGVVEVQDIFDFINGWLAGDPHADTDDSASLSVQDIFDFINLWLAGCP